MRSSGLKKLKWITLAGCAIFAALGFAACNEETVLKTSEEFDYGESVYLYNYVDGTYEVRDSKGETVEIFYDTLLISDDAGYTITYEGENGKGELQIVVRDDGKPRINVPYRKKYVEIGSQVPNMAITVTDTHDGELPYDSVLKKDGQTCADNRFADAGKYEYVITAKDSAGNETTETIVFEAVEEGSRKLYTVADFSDEYGLQQIFELYGYNAEYTTEIHPQNEKGALKLTQNYDSHDTQSFRLKDLFITDLTDYGMFYMEVYSTADIPIKFSVNYGKDYEIPSKTWTEVAVTAADYMAVTSGSHNNVISSIYSKDDINGILFGTFIDWFTMQMKEIYIGSIYAVPYVNAGTMNRLIEDTDREEDPETMSERFDWVEKIHSCMPGSELQRVTGYYELGTKVLKSDRALKGYEIADNQLAAFDDIIGEKQASTYFSYGYYTDRISYGDEKGSFCLVSTGGWRADVVLTMPFKQSIVSYSSLYVWVYHEDARAEYSMGFGDSQTQSIVVPAGVWTKVYLDDLSGISNGVDGNITYTNTPTQNNIRELTFYIFADKWNTMVPAGATFYLSNICVE